MVHEIKIDTNENGRPRLSINGVLIEEYTKFHYYAEGLDFPRTTINMLARPTVINSKGNIFIMVNDVGYKLVSICDTPKIDMAEQVLMVVKQFIEDNKISCDEDIYYQDESMVENTNSFVEDLCNAVGYYEGDD